MDENKSGLYIVAIVAVIAVVALVVLVTSTGKERVTVSSEEGLGDPIGSEDAAGMAFSCGSGRIWCINSARNEAFCMPESQCKGAMKPITK